MKFAKCPVCDSPFGLVGQVCGNPIFLKGKTIQCWGIFKEVEEPDFCPFCKEPMGRTHFNGAKCKNKACTSYNRKLWEEQCPQCHAIQALCSC